MTLPFVLFLAILLTSAVMTGLVRQYALRRNVVDRPTARGLHDSAVPRGGGAAIAIVVSVALLVLVFNGLVDGLLGVLWAACGLGYGVLGWVDDHVDLPAAVRFVGQLILAVIFCLPVLATAAQLEFGSLDFDVLLLIPVCVVAMVWMVNLYNFMDGADGFAAVESSIVAGAGVVIIGMDAKDSALIAVLVAGASAGFLIWNWQPARIFMGDVGSYFLGFQFAALILHGAIGRSGAWVWLILLAPFITDASLTLLRRILNREQWWRAHRTHAYQRLILAGWSHARLCLALVTITILVLVPAAIAAARYPSWAPGATVTIYLLAAIIWTAIIIKTAQRA